MADFRTYRGFVDMAAGATGANATLPSTVDRSRTVERITCVQNSGSGPSAGTGTVQNNQDVSARVLLNTMGGAITGTTDELQFRRPPNGLAARIYYEVVEYIGAAGGDNEWVVLARGNNSGTATTLTPVPLSPTDPDKVGAWICGIQHDAASRDWDRGRCAISWDVGNSELDFLIGDILGTVNVNYVAVEFTGSAWSDVQWVEHTFTAGDTDETEAITAVSDWANVMIWSSYRSGFLRSMDAVSWTVRKGATTSALRFRIHGTPSGSDQVANAWLVENANLTVGHYSTWEADSEATKITSAGTTPDTHIRSITAVDDLGRSSIVLHATSDVAGNGYPTGWWGYTLNAADQYTLFCARPITFSESELALQVIEWPDTATGTDYTDAVDDGAAFAEEASAPGIETVHWRVTAAPIQIQEYDASGATVGSPITTLPAFMGGGSLSRQSAVTEAVRRAEKYGPGGSSYAGGGIQVIEVEPGTNWFHGSWSKFADVDNADDGYWNSNYPSNPKNFPDSDYRPIRDLKITTTTPGVPCTLHNGRIGRLIKEDANTVDPGPIDGLWYDEVEFLWTIAADGGLGNTNQQYCWGGGIDQRNQNGYVKITNSIFRRFPGPYASRFIESCIRAHSMILHIEDCQFIANPTEHLVYVDVPKSPFDVGAGYQQVGTEIQTQPGTDRRGLTIRNVQHIADTVTGDPAETGRTWVQVAQRAEGNPPGNGNSGPGDGEILIEDCVFNGNGNFGAHGLTFVGFVGRPGADGFGRIILRNLQLLNSNAGLILSWSDWGKGIFTKQSPTGVIEQYNNAPPPGGDAGWNTLEYTHWHTGHLVIDNVLGTVKPGANQQRSLIAIEGTELVEIGQFAFSGQGRPIFDFHFWTDQNPGSNRWTNAFGGGQGPLDNGRVRFVTQASTSPYVTTPMNLAGGEVADYGGFQAGVVRVRYGSQVHPDSQNNDGNLTVAEINALRDQLGDINYPPFGPGAGTGTAYFDHASDGMSAAEDLADADAPAGSMDFFDPVDDRVFTAEDHVPIAGYFAIVDDGIATDEDVPDLFVGSSINYVQPVNEGLSLAEGPPSTTLAEQFFYYASTAPGGSVAAPRSRGGQISVP